MQSLEYILATFPKRQKEHEVSDGHSWVGPSRIRMKILTDALDSDLSINNWTSVTTTSLNMWFTLQESVCSKITARKNVVTLG